MSSSFPCGEWHCEVRCDFCLDTAWLCHHIGHVLYKDSATSTVCEGVAGGGKTQWAEPSGPSGEPPVSVSKVGMLPWLAKCPGTRRSWPRMPSAEPQASLPQLCGPGCAPCYRLSSCVPLTVSPDSQPLSLGLFLSLGPLTSVELPYASWPHPHAVPHLPSHPAPASMAPPPGSAC